MSFSDLAKRTVYPLLVSSQMVPKVAIAPVFIIWFGTGLEAKVLISFLIAFFPIMVSTMVGLEAIDADMVRLFRSMGAGAYRTFMKLRLPAALPNIFAGLKIGMSLAVVGAVVAEFVAADRGLGYYLLYANGQLDTPGVFGALLLLMLPSALHLALHGPDRRSRLLGWLSLPCSGLVMATAASRGGAILLLAVSLAYILRQRLGRHIVPLLLGVVASVALLLLGPGSQNFLERFTSRSEERRVGKECRSRWSPYH